MSKQVTYSHFGEFPMGDQWRIIQARVQPLLWQRVSCPNAWHQLMESPGQSRKDTLELHCSFSPFIVLVSFGISSFYRRVASDPKFLYFQWLAYWPQLLSDRSFWNCGLVCGSGRESFSITLVCHPCLSLGVAFSSTTRGQASIFQAAVRSLRLEGLLKPNTIHYSTSLHLTPLPSWLLTPLSPMRPFGYAAQLLPLCTVTIAIYSQQLPL